MGSSAGLAVLRENPGWGVAIESRRALVAAPTLDSLLPAPLTRTRPRGMSRAPVPARAAA